MPRLGESWVISVCAQPSFTSMTSLKDEYALSQQNSVIFSSLRIGANSVQSAFAKLNIKVFLQMYR